jgi:nucleoid DNA-binding protein
MNTAPFNLACHDAERDENHEKTREGPRQDRRQYHSGRNCREARQGPARRPHDHSRPEQEDAAVFDAVPKAVAEASTSGKSVGLPGIGIFSVKATAARQGVRPGTSEKVQIPAGQKVSYKVALDLKKSL